jgi:hypothetical protein
MRRVWNPKEIKKAEKEENIYMIIRGKIINIVQLNDIGKRVEYGKEISLNEYEVNRSKDLQNAIRREWVEVVFDRAMLKRSIATQSQQEIIAETDIVNIAKTMAQSMAEEMLRNSPIVKEVAKEIAKEMVSEIRENLKIEQVVKQVPEQKIEINDTSSNLFVDFKDEEVGIKANIKEIGTVEVQKDDLASSLEKMKKFRQAQKEGV